MIPLQFIMATGKDKVEAVSLEFNKTVKNNLKNKNWEEITSLQQKSFVRNLYAQKRFEENKKGFTIKTNVYM